MLLIMRPKKLKVCWKQQPDDIEDVTLMTLNALARKLPPTPVHLRATEALLTPPSHKQSNAAHIRWRRDTSIGVHLPLGNSNCKQLIDALRR